MRVLPATRGLAGDLTVPGDKSIAQRAVLLGGICRGDQVIHNLPASQDVASALDCVSQLGAAVNVGGNTTTIRPGQLPERVELDAGNSGTTARLLAGLLCGQGVAATIDGDASLRRRPMQRIVDPLTQMGADIDLNDGKLPLRIARQQLRAIEYTPPVASAQVKSAVLLAGLGALGTTRVIETIPTRDHTEIMLRRMGVDVVIGNGSVEVAGGIGPRGIEQTIPGDFSSAMFWLVAAAITRDSQITIDRVGLNPRRTTALRVLEQMGMHLQQSNVGIEEEPLGTLQAETSELRATDITDPHTVAGMIDEFPIVAVAAARANGITRFAGIGELRVKESDRIASITALLRAFGVKVEADNDSMTVHGRDRFDGGATIDAAGDHRIAMAAAIAALAADSPTRIIGAEVASVSYAGFFADLERLRQ